MSYRKNGMKRATAKEVAALAGVSRSLVSMVLSGNPNTWIARETRQRIEAAVRELNYTPNRTASSLRNGRSGTVCLILGGISDPGKADFVESMVKEFERCGLRLYLSFTQFEPEREHAALANAMQLDYDAIVYSLWPEYVEDLQKKLPPEYPLFYSEPLAPGAAGHSVYFDINPALEALISENPGKSIALWGTRFLPGLPEGITAVHAGDTATLLKIRPEIIVIDIGAAEISAEAISSASGYAPAVCILDKPAEDRSEKLAEAVMKKIAHPDHSTVRIAIPVTIYKGKQS